MQNFSAIRTAVRWPFQKNSRGLASSPHHARARVKYVRRTLNEEGCYSCIWLWRGRYTCDAQLLDDACSHTCQVNCRLSKFCEMLTYSDITELDFCVFQDNYEPLRWSWKRPPKQAQNCRQHHGTIYCAKARAVTRMTPATWAADWPRFQLFGR